MKKRMLFAALCLSTTVFTGCAASDSSSVEFNIHEISENKYEAGEESTAETIESADNIGDYSSYSLKKDSGISAAGGSSEVISNLVVDDEKVSGNKGTESTETPVGNVSNKQEEEDENTSDDKLKNYAEDTIEYVSFCPQTLTNTNSALVLTNLGSNKYPIKFTVSYGNNTQSVTVDPDDAKLVERTALGLNDDGTYTVKIVSQAVVNGVTLNGVEQDVKITIKNTGGEIVDSVDYGNEENGNTYNTLVVYDSDSAKCSVVVPAVLAIKQGERGQSISVGYRVKRVSAGTTISIQPLTKQESENDPVEVSLSGSNKKVTAELSGKDGGAPILSYIFDSTESVYETVGPIHCTLGSNLRAKQGYYGTIQFKVKYEEANS